MTKQKDNFIFYHSWLENEFNSFDDRECMLIIRALCAHNKDECFNQMDEIKADRALYNAYLTCCRVIDDNKQKWLKRSEQNRINGLKGGRPPKAAGEAATLRGEERQYTKIEYEQFEAAMQ